MPEEDRAATTAVRDTSRHLRRAGGAVTNGNANGEPASARDRLPGVGSGRLSPSTSSDPARSCSAADLAVPQSGSTSQREWATDHSSSHPLFAPLFGLIPVGAQKAWLESRERV
jgi:hypothetical protein